MGRGYLLMMLTLNGTALLIYELYGRFGPFHWMMVASLATLAAGYIPTFRKAPGWRYQHAYFMAGSYVGLMAASIAETASRVPGWSFGPSVIISSLVIIVAGIWMMLRIIPRIISGVAANTK